mgnify:CR=1 FL=1
MIDRNDGASRGNQTPLTQEQFDNAPLADLAKLAGHDESDPPVLTCEEVLRRSEKRVFECLAAGYDKATTAGIIAQHPLNTATPSALERAMNRVFGNWRDLQRAAKQGRMVASAGDRSTKCDASSVHRDPAPEAAASKVRSLTDDTFIGEERL